MSFDGAVKLKEMKHTNALALSIVLFIYTCLWFSVLNPFSFSYIGAGLDPSWIAASVWARDKNLIFGSDFIFTSGPWSSLYHRSFDSETALYVIGIQSIAMFCLTYNFFKLSLITKVANVFQGLLICIFALSIIQIWNDAIMIFFCLCLIIRKVMSTRKNSKTDKIFEFGSIIVIAVWSQAKFSIFFMAIITAILLDIIYLTERKIPKAMLVFVISFTLFYMATGASLNSIPEFIISSFDVSSGYALAMSIDGNLTELLIWIAFSTIIIYILTVQCICYRTIHGIVLLFGVGAFLWICLKAGFVRHDGHAGISWAGLSLAALALAMCSFGRHQRTTFVIYVGLSFGAAGVGQFRSGPDIAFANLTSFPRIQQFTEQARNLVEFISSPQRFLAVRQTIAANAKSNVAKSSPLPNINGGIDTIPSIQSTIIANELDYKPRPSVQEYASYTKGIIGRDRKFFVERGPEYLLFAPGSIDGRHPASAEGSLWPMLWGIYEPVDQIRDLLLLKRRAKPIEVATIERATKTGELDEVIRFPRPHTPVFLTIDLQPNILGRVASLLFKPPQLYFELTFEDGSKKQFRLIPALGREGLVVAPTISNSIALVSFLSGKPESYPNVWPISVRVTGAWPYKTFYDDQVSFRFLEVDTTALKEAAATNPFLIKFLETRSALISAISTLKPNPPFVEVSSEGIFAHAPAMIQVNTRSALRIEIAFGIRDGAFTNDGQTDGVCFSIRDQNRNTVYYDRCLNPREKTEDRGMIESTVFLPEGTNAIVAETRCNKNCSWDWSYWSKLKPYGKE